MKLRYEYVGLNRIYDKSNASIFRLDNPGCALRTHYEVIDHNRRIVLKPCRCHNVKLSKRYNLAENKRYNLDAYISGRKKAA